MSFRIGSYHRHGARSAKRHACGSADVPTPRGNWPANASGRHLHSVLRATPRTFGVAAAAITADDLNTRMRLQPSGQRVGRAVSQQVYDTTLLQIDQNRAVDSAFLPGPVIDAQHLRRGGRRERTVASQPQQGVSTDRHGLPRGAAGAGFTAQRQPESGVGYRPERVVRRAKLRTTPGSRSTKVRCWHAGLSQKKRRTLSCRRTCRPTHGKSPGRRIYRLCSRVAVSPQLGQHTVV